MRCRSPFAGRQHRRLVMLADRRLAQASPVMAALAVLSQPR
jgi:hypothetical protein